MTWINDSLQPINILVQSLINLAYFKLDHGIKFWSYFDNFGKIHRWVIHDFCITKQNTRQTSTAKKQHKDKHNKNT